MANSQGYHEDESTLGPELKDRHRAIASIQEELEAVDWYDQRVAAASDPELGAILAHNRDEEKEHASMVLEWLRRRDPALDENLRRYLFTSSSILGVETSGDGSEASSVGDGDGSLGIGSLKGTTNL